MNGTGRVPLTQAPVGQPLRLLRATAGGRLKRRLAEMGLTPGVEMTVVQDAGGPLLVAVRQSRLALGRGMAHHLEVAPLAAGEGEGQG